MDNDKLQTALSLHQAGNFIAAQETYTAILENDPHNVAALNLLGILAAQQEDYILARTYLTRALEFAPQSPSVHGALGNVLMHLNELTAAIQHYHAALVAQPNNAALHNNIAISQQKQGNFSAALEHYHLALQLQPDYVDAHYNLSLILLQQNNYAKAIHHLHHTINLQPQHAEAHSQLAQLYHQQSTMQEEKKNHQEFQKKNNLAIRHYQKSLRLNKNNLTAQHNLGALLLEKNKYNAAIRHCKNAIKLDPLHRETLHNLGAIFLRLNNHEAALKYFLCLAQLEKNFVTYYNLGVIYYTLGKLNDAQIYLLEALKINAGDFAAHTNLGVIYLKQENYVQAEHHYRSALTLQPNNEEIKYILAGITQNSSFLANAPNAAQEYITHLFDNYAVTYDKHLALLAYQAPQLLYIALKENIRELPINKNWNIIDLGCGTGLCGEKMVFFAHKLIGIDLAEKMLAIAQQKNIYTELKLGAIEDVLPQYCNSDTDLIIAGDVFTYCGDLQEIFLSCKNALRKQGFFSFTIEKTLHYPYVLQRSLRFAHSANFIEELAQRNSFTIIAQKNAVIRRHRDSVTGCYIFVLQKK